MQVIATRLRFPIDAAGSFMPISLKLNQFMSNAKNDQKREAFDTNFVRIVNTVMGIE
jgi:hypothetical protein